MDGRGHANHGHLQRAFAQPTASQPGLHAMSSRQLQLTSDVIPATQVFFDPRSKIPLRQGKSFASAIVTMTAREAWFRAVLARGGPRAGAGRVAGVPHPCPSGGHETRPHASVTLGFRRGLLSLTSSSPCDSSVPAASSSPVPNRDCHLASLASVRGLARSGRPCACSLLSSPTAGARPPRLRM